MSSDAPLPYRSQEGLLGVVVTTCVILPFFFWGRIYGRSLRANDFRIDDYVLAVGTLINITVSVLIAIVCMYGMGYHRNEIKPEWIPTCLKLYFYITTLFPIGTTLTKASVCLAYTRLFPSKYDRLYAHVLLVYLGACGLVGFFLALFRCRPIVGFWNRVPGVRCIRGNVISYQTLNLTTDFAVYLWPLRTLASLRLPLIKRTALIFAFILGSIVCGAGIARLALMALAWETNDLPYYAYRTLIAGVLEENIGMMCAFLLGCRPVINEVKKWFACCLSKGSRMWRSPSEVEGSQSADDGKRTIQDRQDGMIAPAPIFPGDRYREKSKRRDEQETRGRSVERRAR